MFDNNIRIANFVYAGVTRAWWEFEKRRVTGYFASTHREFVTGIEGNLVRSLEELGPFLEDLGLVNPDDAPTDRFVCIASDVVAPEDPVAQHTMAQKILKVATKGGWTLILQPDSHLTPVFKEIGGKPLQETCETFALANALGWGSI